MVNRYIRTGWFVLILAIGLLSACDAFEERLAAGTLIAGQLPMVTPGLPESEGVGGGADDDDDGLQGPGAIATSIQYTLDAMNAMTASAQITTLTPDATLTVPGPQLTSLAQTLTALVVSSTPTIDLTPSATSTPTATFTPSATPTNFTPEPTETPCNALRFVSHVTYPPGSIVQPDQEFYKSWHVQNIGSCTWTPGYALVYYAGFQLGGRSPLYLSSYIQPGKYVTITTRLYSNPQPGTYQGQWLLQDNQGITFGGGENRNEPLYVEIIVPGQPQPAFTSPASTPPPFYTSTPSP